MSARFRSCAAALLPFASVLLASAPAAAAQWQTNVNYGANTRMDLYVPDNPDAAPGIVVVLHYCGGNAGNAHGWLQSYADMYGFVLITPQAGGNCFDAAASRAGERANIASMVEYTLEQESGDASRVFAVGASSGACMTQALLAAYPEVFAAGSSLAGVPAGAWTGGNSYAWSTSGTSGGQAWGDKVRNANPGYMGPRPRVQLWHGQGDTTLTYSQSYPAQVAQWTNVFGVTEADATMESIKPPGAQDTWARTSYEDDAGKVVVEANSGPSNVPHDLSGRGLWADIVRFFELDKDPAPGTGGAGGMGGGGAGGGTAGGSAGTGVGGGGGGLGGSAGAGGSPGGTGGVGGSVPNGGTGIGGSGGTGPLAGAGGIPAAGAGGVPTGSGGMAGAPVAGTGMAGASVAGTGGAASGGVANGGSGGGKAGSPGTAGASAGKSGNTGGGQEPDDDGGCSFTPTGDGRPLGALVLALLGGLGIALRRRRR
ncbi:MAG TPA: PHB depolymerase family esterase [Polyangiaceae bacterium]